MRKGVLVILLFGIFLIPCIYADVTYKAGGIEIGSFIGSSKNVSGYDDCIAGSYEFYLSSRPTWRGAYCWYDSASQSIRKYVRNDYLISCNYICVNNSEEKNRVVDIGLIPPISAEGNRTENIGANRNCTTFIKGFNRTSSAVALSCTYDRGTGLLTEKCNGSCDFLECGYVCLNDSVENSSIEMEQFVRGQVGVENIGANRNCVSIFRGGETAVRSFGANCDYNNVTGDFVKGLNDSYRWWNCDYFCVDDPCTNVVCEGGFCVNGFCVYNKENYWTDMNGRRLDDGERVDFYDYVRLVSDSEPIYNVTGNDILLGYLSVGYWRVGLVGDDFKFNSSDGLISNGSIKVIDEYHDNFPLSVDVLSPSCGDYFNVGDIGMIEISVNDTDDLVFGNISVGGKWVKNFNTSVNNTFVFNYSFVEAGNVGIVVWANNTRNEKFITKLNVMVVNTSKSDIYVASCIDSPKNFDRFVDSSTVFFDASKSRGINYSVSDGSYTVISKDGLNFSWTFLLSDGQRGQPCVGLGTAFCPGSTEHVYAFHRKFPTVNDNRVFLSVSVPEE